MLHFPSKVMCLIKPSLLACFPSLFHTPSPLPGCPILSTKLSISIWIFVSGFTAGRTKTKTMPYLIDFETQILKSCQQYFISLNPFQHPHCTPGTPKQWQSGSLIYCRPYESLYNLFQLVYLWWCPSFLNGLPFWMFSTNIIFFT